VYSVERVSIALAAVPLPEGLADLQPGPALAATLATVDRSRCSAADVLVLLAARARQVAHDQAQLLADLLEAARSEPDAGPAIAARLAEPDPEFGADEAAFTLSWSRQAATVFLGVARDLIVRLPAVYAALVEGQIDLVRARVFADATALLAVEKARLVAARLLPAAPALTAGQLRSRLRYQVFKVDPGQAQRRCVAAMAERRVYTDLREDGTAELVGTGLPPHRAAAAFDRVDRLARAARAAGDVRGLQQLRADAYLDLLAGVPFDVRPSRDPVTEAADAVPTGGARVDDPGAMPASVGQDGPDPGASGGDRGACGGVQPAPRRGVVNLHVSLTTLAGLDDDPALLPGWGPVTAEIARQVAADPDMRWQATVTNDRGDPLHLLPIRARPSSMDAGLGGRTPPVTAVDTAPGGPPAAPREARRPTAAAQAYVYARDRTCRAPGCRRRAQACDLDHTRPYAEGGPTEPDNLCTLCRHHHRLRHERGHRTFHLGGATHLWQSPTGRVYVVTNAGDIVLGAEDDPRHTLDHLPPHPPPGLVDALMHPPRAPVATYVPLDQFGGVTVHGPPALGDRP
jgi:hypothetical protein